MSETTHETAVADKVAITALWGGVRIVVIDIETTSAPGGGPQRAVSIAAVTCRLGTVRGKWQTLINPEVPIAPGSRRIHGITDEHLVGEPIFAEVANTIIDLLTEADGEKLIVAGHKISFDVSVLRHELQLVGLDIPNLGTIDTGGALAALVDVRPEKGDLSHLLDALGLTNAKPHDALADATATAEALVTLLNRAAAAGHLDFDELLERISGSNTTRAINPGVKIRADEKALVPTLPADHVAGHATPLSKRAGTKMLAAWQTQVTDCATLRCRHLDARVQHAGPAPHLLVPRLEAVLGEMCDNGDIAGAATVLGALTPLLEHLPPRTGRLGLRNAVLAWSKTWAPKLQPLGRCDTKDPCPACRRRESCPLDTWCGTAAVVALGETDRYARGFFETTGREAGTGAYTSWLGSGVDQRIADAGVWACVEHWRRIGQDVRAQQLVELAWTAGCRHPDVADAYAGHVAASGRLVDLNDGMDICDTAFTVRADSTHEGWSRLISRRNQLAGRAERLRVRPSGKLDQDGNPVPLRRHHPATPRRVRQPRFVQL
jgi:DNA polymerase III epsilon subunit-like protein